MLKELVLIRHGESLGNVAREQAEMSGAELIELDRRDADVGLSVTGCEQARALGRWFADERSAPVSTILTSPYRRALRTAEIAVEAARWTSTIGVDERLRDRELGILDRLTSTGVRNRYPAEAARRRELGKFYYRPPGGESWADIALRVRSLVADLERLDEIDETVAVFTHDAVVYLFRYVLEQWSEAELLAQAARESITNTGLTRLVRSGARWEAEEQNSVAHLEHAGALITDHPAERDVHPH